MRSSLSLLVAVSLLGLARAALAGDPVAESLFQEGKALLDEGTLDLACPKLAASHEREARSGTLITLAYCHEQQGKIATAWSEYKDAIALAQQEGRADFAANAQQFADAVEPRLSKLEVRAAPGPHEPELRVTVDGTPLAAGSFGVAVAIDPGEHRIAAEARGYHPWEQTLVIGAERDRQTVTIPALERAPEPVAPPPPPEPALPPPRDVAPPAESAPVWPWIAGGVGVAATGVAIGFAVDTLAAGSTLDERCGADRQACPLDYDFGPDRDRESRGEILWLTFGAVGVAGIGAGVIGLVIGAPEPAESAWSFEPSFGGATLTRRFR